MFTVALIGADGAGKTTVAHRLAEDQLIPLKYVYMGINKHASNVMLPTTRMLWAAQQALGRGQDQGGPPDPSRRPRPAGFRARLVSEIKSGLRLVNQIAEEWYRQLRAASYRRQGYVVLYDRHFFADYYAHDIAGNGHNRSWASRLHGYVLNHLYPRPDLLILLDAPAAVLYARKQEGSVELIEKRQEEYRHLADQGLEVVTVNAGQPLPDVIKEVWSCIEVYGRQHGLWQERLPERSAASNGEKRYAHRLDH